MFEKNKIRTFISLIVLGITAGVWLAICVIDKFLPADIAFRTGFYMFASAICFLVIFFDLMALTVLLYHGMQKKVRRVLVTVVMVAVIILYGLAGAFFLFLGLLTHDGEKMLADGRILVTEEGYLGPNTYYVAEPYYIIFRKMRYESDAEGHEFNLEEGIYPKDDESDETEITDSLPDEPKITDSLPDESEIIDSGQNYIDSSNQWIADLYEKIYAQELTDLDSENAGITYYMNARGELIAYVGKNYEKEIQGETVTASLRLVYDRTSKNGEAELVVLYEDHFDQAGNQIDNTSIINFYAVRGDEVIPADKTGWSETGSEAYREATGE